MCMSIWNSKLDVQYSRFIPYFNFASSRQIMYNDMMHEMANRSILWGL